MPLHDLPCGAMRGTNRRGANEQYLRSDDARRASPGELQWLRALEWPRGFTPRPGAHKRLRAKLPPPGRSV